jgi:hypothetical protein
MGAPVRHTSAATGMSRICRGHIDRKAQANLRNLLRSARPPAAAASGASAAGPDSRLLRLARIGSAVTLDSGTLPQARPRRQGACGASRVRRTAPERGCESAGMGGETYTLSTYVLRKLPRTGLVHSHLAAMSASIHERCTSEGHVLGPGHRWHKNRIRCHPAPDTVSARAPSPWHARPPTPEERASPDLGDRPRPSARCGATGRGRSPNGSPSAQSGRAPGGQRRPPGLEGGRAVAELDSRRPVAAMAAPLSGLSAAGKRSWAAGD